MLKISAAENWSITIGNLVKLKFLVVKFTCEKKNFCEKKMSLQNNLSKQYETDLKRI